MCEFCGSVACTLTKQQAMERGPILERYANGFMRIEDPLAWITEQEVIAKFEKGDR